MAEAPRVLFVNSGILGHRAVASLLEDTSSRMAIRAEHINLSGPLTLGERAQRWVLSRRVVPTSGPLSNADFRRWREELNVGLLAARRIAAADRRERVDIVHFHPQPTAYASLGWMAERPAIVSIDATQQLASEEAASPLARGTYAPNIAHDGAVFRRAAAIVSTSHWAASNLVRHYPECGGKVHVLPYPVRSAAAPDLVEERYLRAQRRDAPGRVLFMGGDFRRKGGFELLEAWRAGDFAGRALLDLATDWPLADGDLPAGVRVVRGVAPNSPEWIELWRGADLFVMPTRHEAFGMVFQEAAAAGVPVVATRVNAIPEIVADGLTGMLVDPGDRRALIAAMRAFIESPDLRRRTGAAALERIRAEARMDRYAARLDTIVHSIVEQRGAA
jgi:glycosyltransferase involved in cell wall biosynthesis